MPDIYSRNATVRGFAERNAINAPIQGSAADIIKVAMVRIYNRLEKENMKSKMILQVHDELNFNVVPEELEYIRMMVVEEMENSYKMSVPLKTEIGVGNGYCATLDGLVDYGYWGLLLASFLAATILPLALVVLCYIGRYPDTYL